MENIQNIFNALVGFNEANSYIDLVVIALVIAGGYAAKRYFTTPKPSDALKTLIVGTMFTVIYVALLYAGRHLVNPVKCFISYTVATSFYELILKEATKWFNRLTGAKAEQP